MPTASAMFQNDRREAEKLAQQDSREHGRDMLVRADEYGDYGGGISADAAFGRDPRFQKDANASENLPF